MKKLLCLLVALTAATSATYAQDVKGDIKAGEKKVVDSFVERV